MIRKLSRLIEGRENGQNIGQLIPWRKAGKTVGKLIRAGDAANRERRWAQAERYYADALKLDPRLTAIWVQYGHSLKEQGLFHKAEDAYRRALALDDRVPDTHLQLGHILKLQNRIAEAISAYQVCHTLDPRSQDVSRELQALGAASVIPVNPMGQPDRKSRVPVDGVRAISAGNTGLFDRRSHVPVDFTPDVVATRSDSSDIKALYLLLLGRFPEKWEVFSENRGRPIVEVTRDLLRSSEFHKLVLVPLMTGRRTRHNSLDQAELEFVKAWIDRFAGNRDDALLSWVELLRRYLDREPLTKIFSGAVLASLQPEVGQLSGRELIGKLFGQEGISVQLLVDGNAVTEFRMNGADRPQGGDNRDDTSRFRLSIPLESYDGCDHDIVVRDAMTQLPVPPGRFTARLVPSFEGVVIASCARLRGWVRRTPLSEHRVTIDLRDGEQVLSTTVADQPTGNPLAGEHGFELAIPAMVPARASICLDGIPITLLTDDVAVPTRVSPDAWQINLGRSNVVVTDESAIEIATLPLGFSLDSITESILRCGHLFVLDGIHDLAARGDDPEPAIAETLRYVAISKDYTLLRTLRCGWIFIASRPGLFEQSVMLCLDAGDLDGAGQLILQTRTCHREMRVSVDLVQAMLDACKVEKCRAFAGLDPFTMASCHRDAVNSTYSAMIVTIGRQRMLIEQLLRKVESQQTKHRH